MDREAIIKKLEKLTPAQKVLIFVFSFILLAGGYWYFIHRADSEEMSALRADIERLDQNIDKYNKIIAANLPMIEKELEMRVRQFTYAKALLPESSEEKEKLLAAIEKLGRDEGLEFILFQPGAESTADFYATSTINLEMNGDFHSLMRFFSRMSGLDRLVSLQSITFSPQGRSKDSNVIMLRAKSQILMYRALTEEELKAKEEKSKKK